MATAISGPRVLLRQLRETMAEPLASQDRLDKIVNLIAVNMHADVCSFYVLRDDGELELFATYGLKRESVHLTTLRLGEGLVGLIAAQAEPLRLEDAPAHPAFAYRPETGEDPFSAFLGVPVLRAGQTLGVLVVQNKDHRVYGEDETEALLTTATILAEMIATSEFDALIKPGQDIDLAERDAFGETDAIEGARAAQVDVLARLDQAVEIRRGDHFGEDGRGGQQRFGLILAIDPPLGILDNEHAQRLAGA